MKKKNINRFLMNGYLIYKMIKLYVSKKYDYIQCEIILYHLCYWFNINKIILILYILINLI